MKEVLLSNGVDVAFVDDEDYERILTKGSWFSCRSRGGKQITAKNKRIDGPRIIVTEMHRFVVGAKDRWTKVVPVDGNLLNCQKINLRTTQLCRVDTSGGFLKCRFCHKTKPLTDFYFREDSQRHRSNCKDCTPSKSRAQNRRISLKKKYRITVEQWDRMFELQGKRCAICRTPDITKRGWTTDHCHSSNTVRGILCTRCNSMLGHAKDSITTLENAIIYLKNSEVSNGKYFNRDSCGSAEYCQDRSTECCV